MKPHVIALTGFALLAACSSTDASNAIPVFPPESAAGSADSAPPVPAGMAGTYALVRVNGMPLPVTVGRWENCHEDVVDASLSLYSDHQYILTSTSRQVCPDNTVDLVGVGERGRYTVRGNTILLSSETGINDPSPASWVAKPDHRELAVEDLGNVGTMQGDMLAIGLKDRHGTAEFRKQTAGSDWGLR